MADTHISFYLKANRIHIFVKALRKIGSPQRICFMIDPHGETLLLSPYEIRDFKSHGVPIEVYQGSGVMEVSSKKLCILLATRHHWNINRSYRVPGNIIDRQRVVVFNLANAEAIDNP